MMINIGTASILAEVLTARIAWVGGGGHRRATVRPCE